MNGPAMKLLGYVAGQRGDSAATIARFTVADAMTRRDLGTQYFMLEHAVSRDDISGALLHYDIALRYQPASGDFLYPVLTSAMENRELWSAFRPYLVSPPPWLGAFLTYAVRNTTQPAIYAEMLVGIGGLPATEEYLGREAELLRRLIAEAQPSQVDRFYRAMRGFPQAAAQSFALTEEAIASDPRPAVWDLTQTDAISQSIVQGQDQTSEIHGSLQPRAAGTVGRKMALVAPGTYRFSARVMGFEGGDPLTLNFRITCLGQPQALWESKVAAETVSHSLAGSFNVPSSCPVLIARIDAAVAEGGKGAEYQIGAIALARVG